MSYMKRLVEYALQQHGKPATAAALTEDVLALAIDAGASMKVVDSINAKCVSGHLRTLVERGCVRQKGHARDETNRREVPCYVPVRGAKKVPQPSPPPGIPAVMHSSPAPSTQALRAQAAMEELLQQVAADAFATIGRIESQIQDLVQRHQRHFRELKEPVQCRAR